MPLIAQYAAPEVLIEAESTAADARWTGSTRSSLTSLRETAPCSHHAHCIVMKTMKGKEKEPKYLSNKFLACKSEFLDDG